MQVWIRSFTLMTKRSQERAGTRVRVKEGGAKARLPLLVWFLFLSVNKTWGLFPTEWCECSRHRFFFVFAKKNPPSAYRRAVVDAAITSGRIVRETYLRDLNLGHDASGLPSLRSDARPHRARPPLLSWNRVAVGDGGARGGCRVRVLLPRWGDQRARQRGHDASSAPLPLAMRVTLYLLF